MTFGGQLHALRKLKEISQGDLAERAGITRDGLSRIERDQRSPRLETMVGIARALGMPVADLVRQCLRDE